jgi:hypothetical protein
VNLSACPREAFGDERWNELVDRFDEAWLWHRSEFRESVDYRVDQTDHSFVVLDEAKNPLAIVPLRLAHYRVFRVVPVRALRSVGGPATANGLGSKHRGKVLGFVNEHLWALASRLDVMEIEMSCPPMAPALRGERCPRTNPLIWAGCQDLQAQTWVVDLRAPEEAIRAAYADHARKDLRRAARADYQVREASGEADLDMYYRLHCETFRRGGVRPHPRAFYALKFSSFIGKGLARALFALRGGAVVSANITALYKAGAAYYGGVSTRDDADGANRLLMDAQIMWARQNGAEYLETGQAFLRGGSAKYEAISHFKKSFGAELYPLYQGTIAVNPRMRAALQWIDAFRRTRRARRPHPADRTAPGGMRAGALLRRGPL